MDIHREKKNPDLNLTRYTKINSKRATGLHIKCEIVKLWEKKTEDACGLQGSGKTRGADTESKGE